MKKIFIFCGLCISFLFLTGCQGQKKVNLADYLKVSFDGANGHGTVSAGLDEEKVMKDLYGEVAMTDPETFVTSLDEEKKRALKTQASSLKNAEIKINKKKDLSNGDKITVTVNARNVDEFVNGSKGFEVKGLKEVPKNIQDVSNFDELKKEIDDYIAQYYKRYFSDNYIVKECWMYSKNSSSSGYGELEKVCDFRDERTGNGTMVVVSIDGIYADNNKVSFNYPTEKNVIDTYDSYLSFLGKEGFSKVK